MISSVRFLWIGGARKRGNHLVQDVVEFDGRRWRKRQALDYVNGGWWRRLASALTDLGRRRSHHTQGNRNAGAVEEGADDFVAVDLRYVFIVSDAKLPRLSHFIPPLSIPAPIMRAETAGVES